MVPDDPGKYSDHGHMSARRTCRERKGGGGGKLPTAVDVDGGALGTAKPPEPQPTAGGAAQEVLTWS